MRNYHRFQVLSSARQDLFCPESPVWVSRCQLSRDLEGGKRLLQARMVNCSEKTIRQVFLRVVCLGANRERLTQLELVPMQSFSARPGELFGEDRPVEITSRGTVFVEVYAQRVRFSDGSTWDEPDVRGYLAFRAEPVRPADPHYETLDDRARSGGVRNDCYFRAKPGLWVCTCGMPNTLRRLRCARCGANRLWLEQHMDPNLLDAPAPARAPEPPASYPMPAPSVTVVPAPIHSDPPAQPTIIVQPAPESETEEEPVSHAGRNTAIVLAVLLFLALGVFFAYRYLAPYLRYREALKEQAAGNYDEAVAIFEDLGEYRDSLDQISESLARKAAGLMGEGKYQEAMELYTSIGGHEERIADCLYSLGVLAFNGQDVETALEYVEQLQDRYPDYDKTATLAQYCYYSLGNRAAAEAAAETDPARRINLYEEASSYFARTDGYEDSNERIRECAYREAQAYRESNEIEEAIGCFGELGDYKDAAQQQLDCMMEYVMQHLEAPDDATYTYLQKLVEANYSDAQNILDRLNGVGFSFEVLWDEQGEALPDQITDLSKVVIQYSVELRDEQGAVLVLVLYELPDGRQGRALLNTDRSSAGRRSWTDFPFPANCSADGTVTLTFYDAMLGENAEPLQTVTFSFAQSQTPEMEDAAASFLHSQGQETDEGAAIPRRPSPPTGG